MTLSSPAGLARAGARAPTGGSSPRPLVGRGAPAPGRPPSRLRFVAAFAALAAMAGAGSMTLSFLLVGAPVPAGSRSPDLGAYLPVVIFAAAVRSCLFVTARRVQVRRVPGYAEELVEATRTSLLGTAAIIAFAFYWHQGPAGGLRSVLLLDWVLATIASLALAALAKAIVSAMRRQGHDVRHVVVVGTSPSATWFVASVARHPELGYRVVRHFRTGLAPSQLQASLVAIAAKTRLDAILFAAPTVSGQELSQLVTVRELRQVELGVVPELLGSSPAKVRVGAVGDFPVLTLLNEPLPGVRRSLKRTIDVVLACTGLVIAGPLMLATSIAIRIRSPGPVLFRQQRVGMDGRPFEMLKFRTMEAGADTGPHERHVTELIRGNGTGADRALEKLVGDKRVTGVGRFLRRFSIDETPQLVNVLRGDMSVVGPRPPLPYEVAVYEDWHHRRLEAKPGLTGLWQVSGRSRLTFEQMVRLDLRYIETWSPLLDLRIALRTIPALFRRGAA